MCAPSLAENAVAAQFCLDKKISEKEVLLVVCFQTISYMSNFASYGLSVIFQLTLNVKLKVFGSQKKKGHGPFHSPERKFGSFLLSYLARNQLVN